MALQIGSKDAGKKPKPQGKRNKAEALGTRVLEEEEFWAEVQQRMHKQQQQQQ